jgi:hypothetical protein
MASIMVLITTRVQLMKPYRPFYIASALFTLLMLIAGSTLAVNQESFKWHGDYRIFYSAFGSTFLSPEVAVANQIVRGKDRGIVNIAVVEQLGYWHVGRGNWGGAKYFSADANTQIYRDSGTGHAVLSGSV